MIAFASFILLYLRSIVLSSPKAYPYNEEPFRLNTFR